MSDETTLFDMAKERDELIDEIERLQARIGELKREIKRFRDAFTEVTGTEFEPADCPKTILSKLQAEGIREMHKSMNFDMFSPIGRNIIEHADRLERGDE